MGFVALGLDCFLGLRLLGAGVAFSGAGGEDESSEVPARLSRSSKRLLSFLPT